MSRIVVVEPHPDDAFLSLGWHIEYLWKERDVLIVTVFANGDRMDEAMAYAASVGAKSVVLGMAETNMSASARVRPVPALRELVEQALRPDDTVIFPLGLQHPDHLCVAATRPPGALRYLDTPYQTKQKLAGDVLRRTKGMTVESFLVPPRRKWKKAGLFKTQNTFFFYNKPLTESLLPEIVLSAPRDEET